MIAVVVFGDGFGRVEKEFWDFDLVGDEELSLFEILSKRLFDLVERQLFRIGKVDKAALLVVGSVSIEVVESDDAVHGESPGDC